MFIKYSLHVCLVSFSFLKESIRVPNTQNVRKRESKWSTFFFRVRMNMANSSVKSISLCLDSIKRIAEEMRPFDSAIIYVCNS